MFLEKEPKINEARKIMPDEEKYVAVLHPLFPLTRPRPPNAISAACNKKDLVIPDELKCYCEIVGETVAIDDYKIPERKIENVTVFASNSDLIP